MSETFTHTASRSVWLVCRREFRDRLRAIPVVVGTVLLAVVLIGYLLLQGFVLDRGEQTRVGLVGQAVVLKDVLQRETEQLGSAVAISQVASAEDGIAELRSGRLDVLVAGAPDALHVTVNDRLDTRLRAALNGLVRQQALDAQIAEIGLKPSDVQARIDQAQISVTQLRPADPRSDQRLALGLLAAGLVYLALVFFGGLLARGVAEEKSSRLVDALLAVLGSRKLLLGKVSGFTLVGLAQLLVVGLLGLVLAAVTGTLVLPGTAIGALLAALCWFLLGFPCYATVFGATGVLLTDRDRLRTMLIPVIAAVTVVYGLGLAALAQDSGGPLAAVLSVLPPFAPFLMPVRLVIGVVAGWQLLLSILLTLASTVLLGRLTVRVYDHAILRTTGRIRLREALR